jgi:hypothetical protein
MRFKTWAGLITVSAGSHFPIRHAVSAWYARSEETVAENRSDKWRDFISIGRHYAALGTLCASGLKMVAGET